MKDVSCGVVTLNMTLCAFLSGVYGDVRLFLDKTYATKAGCAPPNAPATVNYKLYYLPIVFLLAALTGCLGNAKHFCAPPPNLHHVLCVQFLWNWIVFYFFSVQSCQCSCHALVSSFLTLKKNIYLSNILVMKLTRK